MENPPFFHPSYYNSQFTSDNAKNTDHFVVEDLLDFPNDDTMLPADAAPFTDSSSATPVHSSSAAAEPFFQPHDVSAHHAFADAPFGNELCVPYDDLAELEWVSNFVDESFASEEDLHKVQLMQGMKARNDQSVETHQYHFQPEPTRSGPMLSSEMSVPAKARSKRSRAAPGNWTSRLLVVSPTPTPEVPAMSSSSESDVTGGKKSAVKAVVQKKKEFQDNSGGGEGRKCLHCATDKTPQWRTGPMGPKTLCNACGVRYKSGRLVPEYRPAASPTFVLTKHSNSHRKVLELRRQKEMMRAQQHQQQYLHHHQNMMFDVTNGDDYLIHQHIGPDYRQLI